jgi:hypothetical protein
MVQFNALDDIEPDTPIEELKKKALRDLQRALGFVTYPAGVIDGRFGPRTRNSWAEFKADIGEGNPSIVSVASIAKLKERLQAVNEILDANGSRTRRR